MTASTAGIPGSGPVRFMERPGALLDQINSAPTSDFLHAPPSNRLEKLRGDLTGYWSLRINQQWRAIFRWQEHDALDVEIVDYHR